MNEPGTGELTLLVTQAGRRRSWHLDFTSVRPYVSRVLLVESGTGSYLLPLLGKALPGVDVEHLPLAGDDPPAERTRRLRRKLGNGSRWVLVLNAGCNVSVGRHFGMPAGLTPRNLVHRARTGGLAYWFPALTPDDPAYFSIVPSGRVCVNAAFARDACHDGLVIDDHGVCGESKKELALKLDAALSEHRASHEPAPGFDIAECHFRLDKYLEAEFWYRRYLDEGEDQEKRWLAQYRLACCRQYLGKPWPVVEAALAAAFDAAPDRAEPLHRLARHYLEAGDYGKAFDLAAVGMEIPPPRTAQPFEFSIYQYELPLTYMACAAELGRHRDCAGAANQVLRRPGVPDEARDEALGLRSRAVARFQPFYPLSLRRRNRIVVIVPFRNAGEFLRRCVDSLAVQDYQDCRFVLIDDASDDGALDALDIVDPRFTLIRNGRRVGAIGNQVRAIDEYCRPDDIVVYVDGDDRLACDDALSHINDFFNATRCWVMYGQYTDSRGRHGCCEPITEQSGGVLDAVADMHFPMHVRAHRAGLIGRLREIDPALTRLRDDDGEFLDAIADMAMMHAVMQLAGLDRIRYNDRVLYEYNSGNPASHYCELERRQLQDRQCRALQSREALQPAAAYMPGETGAGKGAPARTRYLFIALDGMTPRLVHQWAADGLLPNLEKIIQAGQVRDIIVPKGFGNDAFWNSLVTGRLPDEHGYYYRRRFRPESYELDFHDPDHELDGETFWEKLSDSDLEMAIIDIPDVKHAGRVNGLEVTEWVTHARLMPSRFAPAGLERDWIERFGTDPTHGNTETMARRTGRQFVELRDRLLATVEQKTRAALHYLDRGGWDLFAAGFSQGHDVGHQFWHVHDPTHPAHRPLWLQRYGDPMLQMYQGVDRAVGRLAARAGQGAGVMIVTGVAMEAKSSCNEVLDEMLWVVESTEYGPPAEGASRGDLRQRRFFAVPHNNLSGAVRINLKGREASGLVEPGRDYRRTLDTLEHWLRQVINEDTGEPVVEELVRIQDVCRGERANALPDLLVLWRRAAPIRRIGSPWLGEVVLRPRGFTDTRTGDHVGRAELAATFDLPFPAHQAVPVRDIAPALVRILDGR